MKNNNVLLSRNYKLLFYDHLIVCNFSIDLRNWL